MYIDVHCHLDAETYGDLADLIAECEKQGITRLIAVGFDIPSSIFARDTAEKFPCVYFAAGFHPTELSKYREGDLEKIEKLCLHEKCVALGEIGLDYHYPDTDKELQREIFLRQLDIAQRLRMPVEIHSRDCAEDMVEILKENKDKLVSGALMHCYSHSPEIAQTLAKLGLYFSFGGASTRKNAGKAKRSIESLPIERLLTETDSPYMPPASALGTFPNTPLAIPEILRSMATIKGVSEEEMCEVVWGNARALFPKLG